MTDNDHPERAPLDRTHTVRLPEKLKLQLMLLNDEQIKIMNGELRETIAKHVHMSRFNPNDYLAE